ncbi:MAG: hypothetical protein FWH38_09615 [Treponema sp.]|nr:hypothetical protein [Treponema sp.]
MPEFTASRLTPGNRIFPSRLRIDSVNVTLYKGRFAGCRLLTMTRSSIASVFVKSGILHGDMVFEAMNRKQIIVKGLRNADIDKILGMFSTKPEKASAEKEILVLAGKMPVLTLKQIILNTSLEAEKAEEALKILIAKGMAKETVDPYGQPAYEFL